MLHCTAFFAAVVGLFHLSVAVASFCGQLCCTWHTPGWYAQPTCGALCSSDMSCIEEAFSRLGIFLHLVGCTHTKLAHIRYRRGITAGQDVEKHPVMLTADPHGMQHCIPSCPPQPTQRYHLGLSANDSKPCAAICDSAEEESQRQEYHTVWHGRQSLCVVLAVWYWRV